MFNHQLVGSVGAHGIMWQESDETVMVTSILIPPLPLHIVNQHQDQQSHSEIDAIAEIISGRRPRSRKNIQRALRHCDFSGCSDWQQEVWRYLALDIPTGRVISYGGLAEKLGRPGAARSVGSCMANNRFPLLIPCHRVVAGGGKLGGFMKGHSDGLDIKRNLLAAEGVVYIGDTLKNSDTLIS